MISQAGQWTQNPICHPSPSKKMKCSFLDYVQLLMIGWAAQLTWTPSTTPLHPKTWNPHFWIMFNFWWSARLVNGLEPHLPPLSTQKSEMIIFGLHSTSDDWPGWLMDSNPIHHNSSVKNEILIFGLRSTSDDQPGWSMDSNPICHPSPAQKMKCSFLDYVQLPIIGLAGRWTQTPSASPLQLLMIGQAGQWTRTPSATPLQPKKWNAHFWITFTLDDWPGWSMDSNPIHHPSPANKMKCFFLDYVHFWWSARLVNGLKTPSATPLHPKKWNAHFWIMFNFWWLAGLVDGLEPHPPPLSTQKNEMLIFGLCSTSDDWLSCLIDLNPIHHPSPPKKMKCLSLYNIQHLMLARLVKGLKPHLPPSLAKKWNAHFWIMFNFW